MFLEQFPFRSTALGDISLHPDLIDFARRALGTDDIALAHSDVTAKYAGLGADYHQDLHLDVSNNSPVTPSAHDPAMEYVPCIIYYTDVTAELGATRVVPRGVSAATPLWPNVRPAGDPLYARERPAEARAGSALIYSLRTWHRGARMTAASGQRIAHHLSFYNGACRWLGATCFHRQAESPEMHALITRSSPQQRWALGFPLPGSPYWTEDTIRDSQLRYPGIDFAPYRERLRIAAGARGG
jgi:hypothetical protein